MPSRAGEVALRPLLRSDADAWRSIRIRDEQFLRPWDVTSALSWERRHTRGEWRRHRTQLRAAAVRREAIAFAIVVDEKFAGQVTFGGIQRGALRSGWVGYWVDSELFGHGVATAAVALAVDHAFGAEGLHRVEATIAPANVASQKVVAHLRFRQEGLLRRYLDIDGGWRDHLLFALTADEVPGGLVAMLQA
ncbi:GNAT family N-acetyltransferase [Nakamurella lactea]|uniref:GNAT family N-acetyltransferase n=1 Tax=Nakamurella lactea TaxID=459515 RepID=UPI00040CA1D0|nr:GNAT family protein [Nakamurella lactea]